MTALDARRIFLGHLVRHVSGPVTWMVEDIFVLRGRVWKAQRIEARYRSGSNRIRGMKVDCAGLILFWNSLGFYTPQSFIYSSSRSV